MTFVSGYFCDKCGEKVPGGLLNFANHPCNAKAIEYNVPTDNELRIIFMETGMPDIGFTFMDIEPPTEMERIIYKK